MSCINNYCILGKKSYSDGYYFIAGYKSLPTMRKKFNVLKDRLSSLPKHDEIKLVARDYNNVIVKTYEKF